MGVVFFIIAAILFFLAGTGIIDKPATLTIWGWFCLAIGLALNGVPLSILRRNQ